MAIAHDQPAERSTNICWCVFSLAFGTSGLLYLHRYVFAFVKPTLAKEYDLSNTELGQLDSAFSLCYTLFQFPLGIVADIAGVHLVLAGLILVWCGGLAMLAWAPSVKLIWFAQATHGTRQSAVYACLNRLARMWYPPALRTTLQGAVGVLAGRLGALGSSLVFTSLLLGVLELDWRTAIWLLVAIGGSHLVLFAIVFRNSPREHPAVNDVEARLIEGHDALTIESSLKLNRSADEGESSPLKPERATVSSMLRSMTPRSVVNLMCLAVQSILSTSPTTFIPTGA